MYNVRVISHSLLPLVRSDSNESWCGTSVVRQYPCHGGMQLLPRSSVSVPHPQWA